MALPVDRRNTSPATVLVAFVGAIALLYFARKIAIPLALALLLSFILSPLVMRLRRWKIPRIAAVIAAVAVSFAVIGAIGALVGEQLVKLAGEIPQYQHNLKQKIGSFRVTDGGVIDQIGNMVDELQNDLAAQAETAAQNAGSGGGRNRSLFQSKCTSPRRLHSRCSAIRSAPLPDRSEPRAW